MNPVSIESWGDADVFDLGDANALGLGDANAIDLGIWYSRSMPWSMLIPVGIGLLIPVNVAMGSLVWTVSLRLRNSSNRSLVLSRKSLMSSPSILLHNIKS